MKKLIYSCKECQRMHTREIVICTRAVYKFSFCYLVKLSISFIYLLKNIAAISVHVQYSLMCHQPNFAEVLVCKNEGIGGLTWRAL